MSIYSGTCARCGRYGVSDGPMDEVCPRCEFEMETAPRIKIIALDPAWPVDVGCTVCSKRADFITVYEDDIRIEVVEAACAEHAEIE